MNVKLDFKGHRWAMWLSMALSLVSVAVLLAGSYGWETHLCVWTLVASNALDGWRLRSECHHWKTLLQRGILDVVDRATVKVLGKDATAKPESASAVVRQELEKETAS